MDGNGCGWHVPMGDMGSGGRVLLMAWGSRRSCLAGRQAHTDPLYHISLLTPLFSGAGCFVPRWGLSQACRYRAGCYCGGRLVPMGLVGSSTLWPPMCSRKCCQHLQLGEKSLVWGGHTTLCCRWASTEGGHRQQDGQGVAGVRELGSVVSTKSSKRRANGHMAVLV